MHQFTRIFIGLVVALFVGVVFLASSQGWWHYTFRNAGVIKQNQQYNKEYQQYYHQGGFYQSGVRHHSTRSFRSGTRGGWGK
jgi:hypothetical protein